MVSSDPNAAAQELVDMAAGLEQKARQFEDLRTRMTALSFTEVSRDGQVRITIDANGVPTEITLTDRARGVDPAALSAQIMSCLATVQARLRERVTDMVHESVGGDSAGEMLIGQYTDRFPDPDPEPDSALPPDSPAPPPLSPPPVSVPPSPQTAESAGRGSWRDTVVTPDEPDEDDLYFRNKNWLE